MAASLAPLMDEAGVPPEERRLLLGAGLTNLGALWWGLLPWAAGDAGCCSGLLVAGCLLLQGCRMQP